MKKAIGQTVRDLKRGVNKKVLKIPGIEQKILDATSNEPWGPHGSQLIDIAHATRNHYQYQLIMSVIWKRLNDSGKNWRHVYKGLTVLEYLVAHGAERVIDEIREHSYQISTLSHFQYIDSSGRDLGSNVRTKSEVLVALANDKERIQKVRQKAFTDLAKSHEKDEALKCYGEDRGRKHRRSYGDEMLQTGNDDFPFDSKARVRNHSLENDRRCSSRIQDHGISQPNVDAPPPNYEETAKEVERHNNKERDLETSDTCLPLEEASPFDPPSSSLSESTNQDALNKFDSCGFTPDAQNAAPVSNMEMDFFGSLTEDSTSSNPMPMACTNIQESYLSSILGLNGNFVDLSSSSAAPNMYPEDPFGDSPFKAIPEENTIAQQKDAFENSGVNDILADLFPQTEPATASIFSEVAPTDNNYESLLAQPSLAAPINSQEAPQNPFNSFSQSRPSSKEVGPQNPFVQPVPLNLTSTYHENHVTPFGLSSDGPSQMCIAQSDLSLQSMVHSASSQGFPPTQNMNQTGIPVLLPPNYIAQSGSLSQATTCIIQSGLSVPSLASQTMSSTVMDAPPPLPPSKISQSKEKFETKSTVWADTLSRGLVNLDISGVKTNPLDSIGIDFDSINRKDKRKEEKNPSNSVSTLTMGKAMGSGSGMGLAGATNLAPPPNSMVSPGMGGYDNIGMKDWNECEHEYNQYGTRRSNAAPSR